jgi:hypothetical protein
VQTPDEKQSPSGVGVTSALSASAMLTAVEAADALPSLSVTMPPASQITSRLIAFAAFHLPSFSGHLPAGLQEAGQQYLITSLEAAALHAGG